MNGRIYLNHSKCWWVEQFSQCWGDMGEHHASWADSIIGKGVQYSINWVNMVSEVVNRVSRVSNVTLYIVMGNKWSLCQSGIFLNIANFWYYSWTPSIEWKQQILMTLSHELCQCPFNWLRECYLILMLSEDSIVLWK